MHRRLSTWFTRLERGEWIALAAVSTFIFALAVTPLAVSFAVSPDAIERGDVQLSHPCPHMVRFGTPCAGCGLTRGFCALSRGRLGDALRYNAATPYLYSLLLLIATNSGLFALWSARSIATCRVFQPTGQRY